MTSSLTIYCGATVATASAVVVGVASNHNRLAVVRAEPSVVVIRPVGLVAVPTATSPILPADRDAEAELDGLREADELEDSEADGETDELGDTELEGLNERDALADGDSEALVLELGLKLALALELGESDAETEEELDELGEAEELGLIEVLADGERELDGETETELEGLREADLEDDGDKDAEAEDDSEELGEAEDDGLSEADTEADGETERETEVEADGESEAEAYPKPVVTLPNIRIRTAPVTVNKVAVPTAPAPTAPVKVIVLLAWIDQSGEVTGALFALFWKAILVFYFPYFLYCSIDLSVSRASYVRLYLEGPTIS